MSLNATPGKTLECLIQVLCTNDVFYKTFMWRFAWYCLPSACCGPLGDFQHADVSEGNTVVCKQSGFPRLNTKTKAGLEI